MTSQLAIVVLISGRGTNLRAIMDAITAGALPVDLRAVVCNEPDAPGLDPARRAGYEVAIVHHRDFPARDRFDAALAETVDRFDPQLVVLAGFMRILTAGFVRRYAGRLINIHPSLLPAFPGLHTHARAIAAGAGVHGATVHFVTGKVDGGPIVAQARVPVLPGDDPDTLAARVLEREHVLLPRTLLWFAQRRVRMEGDHVLIDGIPARSHPEASGSGSSPDRYGPGAGAVFPPDVPTEAR